MEQTGFKKKLSLAMASMLMISALGQATYAEHATNVANVTSISREAEEASVTSLPFKDNRLLNPDDPVTRDLFFQMLTEALGLQVEQGTDSFPYVQAAEEQGWFEPKAFPYRGWEEPLRKHELAHIAVRALQSGEKLNDDMYDAVRLGLLGGTEDGQLEPAVKITQAQAALAIDRILRAKQGEKLPVDRKALKNAEKVKSARKDSWGRAIRTTNLPKNHRQFPYILEQWPNEMYNLNHDFKPYNTNINPAKFTNLRSYADKSIIVYNTDHLVNWVDDAEKYISQIINVDYNKLDNSWMGNIKETVNPQNLEYINNQLNDNLGAYITSAKKNKVKVTGGIVKAEPSIMFIDGETYIRIYFTFKATSFTDQSKIFYDPAPRYRPHMDFFKSVNIKKNVEYEVFANLGFVDRSYGSGGVLTSKAISFYAYVLEDAIIREKK
ncbi:S-layer homology domain-containing protein [Cohnella boryungensis]|uniref:S-layer homology domain-containing protein n=1 Tax=Cohnella boryungensis TaxID=768479 RepID=A0ABV8SHL3_9BACL